MAIPGRRFAVLTLGLPAALAVATLYPGCDDSTSGGGTPENCANRIDDDGDGVVDCIDPDCRSNELCQSNPEQCADALDNDLDGDVDCTDSDCAASPYCSEDCGNGADDNGDTLADCDDPQCKGVDPRCGEICGDGKDNDGDGAVDCLDPDCADVKPPCGDDPQADGTICAYGDEEPHTCQCADGDDNDGDGQTDDADLHCFGPFDDDEATYATGIPGDNMGSKADKECPFDGNSGTGNDGFCCNPDNASQNVTPNGCDEKGCCEIDVNRNTTGEHVLVREDCVFAPSCGSEGKHGCACTTEANCDAGQFCVLDDDSGAGVCSTCEPCTPNEQCVNTCECGELCFGGFRQPAADCGTDQTGDCPGDVTPCPGGDADCSAERNERCSAGCCWRQCADGVVRCDTSLDCPTDIAYYCITGCCIEQAPH